MHRSRATALGVGLIVAAAACTDDVEREPFLELHRYGGGAISELRVHCRDGDRFMVSQRYEEPGVIDGDFVAGVLLDLPADAPRRVVVRGTQAVAFEPTATIVRVEPACDWPLSGPTTVFGWYVFGGVSSVAGVQDLEVTVRFDERSATCVRGTADFTATGAIPGSVVAGSASGYGPFEEPGCTAR